MEADAILEIMKGYFKGKVSAEVMDTFAEQAPGTLLKESLDVVDFLVYLEDDLGREIDINDAGQAVLKPTFRDLAIEVSRLLAAAA